MSDYARPIEPQAVFDYTYWFDDKKLAWSLRWKGIPLNKTPSDMWVYQEILHEVRPKRIIEFGTMLGGTTIFLADMLDILHIDGRVLTIDIDPGKCWPSKAFGDYSHIQWPPKHDRIDAVKASSLDVYNEVYAWIDDVGPVLIIEDSEHSYQHVHAELNLFAHLISVGSYFIVEDTGMGQYPSDPVPGVALAVQDFLINNPNFQENRYHERFGHTTIRGGFLRRIS